MNKYIHTKLIGEEWCAAFSPEPVKDFDECRAKIPAAVVTGPTKTEAVDNLFQLIAMYVCPTRVQECKNTI